MNKMPRDSILYEETYKKGNLIQWPLRASGQELEVAFVELRKAGLVERNGKKYYINEVCIYTEKKD